MGVSTTSFSTPRWPTQTSLYLQDLRDRDPELMREIVRVHHADLEDRLLEPLVRDKVRARFGGRVKGVISGGARLDPTVGKFFRALGIPLAKAASRIMVGDTIAGLIEEGAEVAPAAIAPTIATNTPRTDFFM